MGRKGILMTSRPASLTTAATGGRAVPLLLAALFGLAVAGFAGFAPIEAVHNGAHDWRHSMGFPCH